MEPTDYTKFLPNPTNFAANYLQGIALGDAMKARQEQIQLQNQYRDDLDMLSKNPTADNILAMMVKHPEQADKFKKPFEALQDQQKQDIQSSGNQIFSALSNNNVDLAKRLVDDRITAYKNSGLNTSNLDAIKNMLESDPSGNSAKTMVGLQLASIDPKFAENYGKMGEESRKQALFPEELKQAVLKTQKEGYETSIKGTEAAYKKPELEMDLQEKLSRIGLNKANVKNISNQIWVRTQNLGLDRQKTAAYVADKLNSIGNTVKNMPADVRKGVNDAAVSAALAGQNAAQWGNLSTRFQNISTTIGRTGKLGTGVDWVRNVFGSQDDYQMLKKEYIGMKTQGAKEYLPGTTQISDNDMKIAMARFPDESTDPKTLAAFTRGMQKTSLVKKALEDAKADWLAQNGTLGRISSSFRAGDYVAKSGQSFPEYAQTVMTAVVKKFNKDNSEKIADVNPPSPLVPSGKAKELINEADLITGFKQ